MTLPTSMTVTLAAPIDSTMGYKHSHNDTPSHSIPTNLSYYTFTHHTSSSQTPYTAKRRY